MFYVIFVNTDTHSRTPDLDSSTWTSNAQTAKMCIQFHRDFSFCFEKLDFNCWYRIVNYGDKNDRVWYRYCSRSLRHVWSPSVCCEHSVKSMQLIVRWRPSFGVTFACIILFIFCLICFQCLARCPRSFIRLVISILNTLSLVGENLVPMTDSRIPAPMEHNYREENF